MHMPTHDSVKHSMQQYMIANKCQVVNVVNVTNVTAAGPYVEAI